MLQTRYSETMQKHYLIISGNDLPECELEEQMLRHNEPAGLLKTEVHVLNNKSEFYYDITGMVPLSTYVRHTPMNEKILSCATEALVRTVLHSKEYFIDENDFVFEKELIYLKVENNIPQFRFCCVPGYHHPLRDQITRFFEDLMKSIDYSDKTLVNYVYSVYKKISDPNCVFEDLTQKERPEERIIQKPVVTERKEIPDKSAVRGEPDPANEKQKKPEGREVRESREVRDGRGKQGIREYFEKISENRPYFFRYVSVTAAGFAIGIILAYAAIKGFFVSTGSPDWKRIIASVAAAGGLGSFIYAELRTIKRMKKDEWDTLKEIHKGPLAKDARYNGINYARPGDKSVRKTADGFKFADFLVKEEAVNVVTGLSDEKKNEQLFEEAAKPEREEEQYITGSMLKKPEFKTVSQVMECRTTDEKNEHCILSDPKVLEEFRKQTEPKEPVTFCFDDVISREQAKDITAIVNGSEHETIVLDASTLKEGFYLDPRYGNVYGKVTIDFFPYCVGSSSLSDGIILSRTVSRRHAVFEKDDKGICIRDLNSKNGTYVNGSRLYRGECVRIMPDDVIAFSDKEYILRRKFVPKAEGERNDEDRMNLLGREVDKGNISQVFGPEMFKTPEKMKNKSIDTEQTDIVSELEKIMLERSGAISKDENMKEKEHVNM